MKKCLLKNLPETSASFEETETGGTDGADKGGGGARVDGVRLGAVREGSVSDQALSDSSVSLSSLWLAITESSLRSEAGAGGAGACKAEGDVIVGSVEGAEVLIATGGGGAWEVGDCMGCS